jgi:hypothetical protein
VKQLQFNWKTDPPVEIPIQLLRSMDELCASMGARLTDQEKSELITACRIACAGSGETAFWREVRRRLEIRERSNRGELN